MTSRPIPIELPHASPRSVKSDGSVSGRYEPTMRTPSELLTCTIPLILLRRFFTPHAVVLPISVFEAYGRLNAASSAAKSSTISAKV
jgi:hypothetical protein